jgi:hypothetical protein
MRLDDCVRRVIVRAQTGAITGFAEGWVATACAGVIAALPLQQTREPLVDGHRVMLDVHTTAGTPRGAAILSHGITRRKLPIATVRSGPGAGTDKRPPPGSPVAMKQPARGQRMGRARRPVATAPGHLRPTLRRGPRQVLVGIAAPEQPIWRPTPVTGRITREQANLGDAIGALTAIEPMIAGHSHALDESASPTAAARMPASATPALRALTALVLVAAGPGGPVQGRRSTTGGSARTGCTQAMPGTSSEFQSPGFSPAQKAAATIWSGSRVRSKW